MEPAGEVALRVLAARFAHRLRPGAEGDGPIPLWAHQAEGVARVRETMERRGGAILADSVGLGKTHIALALVAEQLAAGGEAAVIVPASLRPFWRRKLRLVPGRPAPRLLSHTQLARGVPIPRPSGGGLLVVDEAHRFRNPGTLRYAALAAAVGPGVRVLLITATPVNNGIHDLLHLLRLFAADDGFRDLGISSLASAFEAADAGRAAEAGQASGAVGPRGTADPSPPIDSPGPARAPGAAEGPSRIEIPTPDSPLRRVVGAVVVRRTRAMVRVRFGEPAAFPRRALPRVIAYEDARMHQRVAGILSLELALYGGAVRRDRESPDRGGSTAEALVRLGLLKRLDSSRHAFERSVLRLRGRHQRALEAVRAGRLPELRVGGGGSPDADPLQLVMVELVTRPAPPGADLERLARSLVRDLRRMDALLAGSADDATDPKLKALIRVLERRRGERVLVFTEYRDTARALWHALADRFRVGRIDGGGAWLGRTPAGRRLVVERFAPRANGLRSHPGREEIRVLVATDVLAEGLNLQDARYVVSYDLPWNPVRLLQRIGRVDRAGSHHEEVVPILFTPTTRLDLRLGLTRRLESKLRSIRATVGAEHTVALLQELAAVDRRDTDGAGIPARAVERELARIEADDPDPVERLRTLWVRHRERLVADPPSRPGSPASRGVAAAGADPSTAETAAGAVVTASAPARATLQVDHASPAADLLWVVAARLAAPDRTGPPAPDGTGPPDPAPATLLEVDRAGDVGAVGLRAVDAISRALQTPHGPPDRQHTTGGSPPDLPLALIRQHLRDTLRAAAAPPHVAPCEAPARLATRLRQAMARAGTALDPALFADADRALAALAVPPGPRAEPALRELASKPEPIASWPAEPDGEARWLISGILDAVDSSPRSSGSAETAVSNPGRELVRRRPGAESGGTRSTETSPEVIAGLRIVVDASWTRH